MIVTVTANILSARLGQMAVPFWCRGATWLTNVFEGLAHFPKAFQGAFDNLMCPSICFCVRVQRCVGKYAGKRLEKAGSEANSDSSQQRPAYRLHNVVDFVICELSLHKLQLKRRH